MTAQQQVRIYIVCIDCRNLSYPMLLINFKNVYIEFIVEYKISWWIIVKFIYFLSQKGEHIVSKRWQMAVVLSSNTVYCRLYPRDERVASLLSGVRSEMSASDFRRSRLENILSCILQFFTICSTSTVFACYLPANTSHWEIGIPLVILVIWTFKSDIFSRSFRT